MQCWEWEYNIPAWAWFVCLGSVGCLNQVFVKQGLSDFSGRVPHLWSMSKIPLGGKSLISVLVKYWPMASPSQESSKGGQHRKTSQPRRSLNMEGVEEQLSHFPPPLEVLAALRKMLGALCLLHSTAVFIIIPERQFHVFMDSFLLSVWIVFCSARRACEESCSLSSVSAGFSGSSWGDVGIIFSLYCSHAKAGAFCIK